MVWWAWERVWTLVWWSHRVAAELKGRPKLVLLVEFPRGRLLAADLTLAVPLNHLRRKWGMG